jgi:hypothetical protein
LLADKDSGYRKVDGNVFENYQRESKKPWKMDKGLERYWEKKVGEKVYYRICRSLFFLFTQIENRNRKKNVNAFDGCINGELDKVCVSVTSIATI